MSTKKIEQLYFSKDSDFASDLVDLEGFSKLSVQVRCTNDSSFSGNCILQLSNDYESWVDVLDTLETISGSDVKLFDVQTAAGYARISFTVTAGSTDVELDWVLKP
jgi:hypothetical protein